MEGKTKQRKCLKCGQMFLSTWKGNRICPSCNAQNLTEKGPRECKVIIEGRKTANE